MENTWHSNKTDFSFCFVTVWYWKRFSKYLQVPLEKYVLSKTLNFPLSISKKLKNWHKTFSTCNSTTFNLTNKIEKFSVRIQNLSRGPDCAWFVTKQFKIKFFHVHIVQWLAKFIGIFWMFFDQLFTGLHQLMVNFLFLKFRPIRKEMGNTSFWLAVDFF